MSPAVVALLLAAPVVKLETGSGVVVPGHLMFTPHAVAFATGRPEGHLEDGGLAELVGVLVDDEKNDLALVGVVAEVEPAVLGRGQLDAGTPLWVANGVDTWDAVLVAATPDSLELSIPDAGQVAGAALLDARGVVWGMVRDEHRAVPSTVLADLLDQLSGRGDKRRSTARWRNLGISAAFFLGLAGWWVYRSKRLRY